MEKEERFMKKFAAILLAFLTVISLAACGDSNGSEKADTEPTVTGTPEAPTEPESGQEEAEHPGTASEEQEENTVDREDGKKVLVAYFSATNTTEGVAEQIADGLLADIYEIVPQEPYTDADLDYGDDNSRSSIEMNDSAARPAISGSVEDMEQYEIVFIGYPIWWGDTPRIVSTFVESYDFSGKTVIPFCTSGGSGIGSSGKNLEQLTDGGDWLEGGRLSGGASREDIVSWVNELGLEVTAQ